MRKEFLSLICIVGLVGGATQAMAGAYGEPEQREETPAASPAAPEIQAPEGPDYNTIAPYLGMGGIYAVELFDDAGARVDNSGGFHVRVGYRAHRNFAVEALYEYYSQFDTDPGHYNGWSATINGLAILPLGRVQPYALIGLGFMNINGSGGNPGSAALADDGFIMRFGGGIDMCITEHWSTGPEVAYVLPFGDIDNLDLVTVSMGVTYKL